MRIRTSSLRWASCPLALALALPAHAQDASSGQTETNSEGLATATGMNDIIVTAQRRSERLQDVPLSVSVVGAEALQAANVRNSIDLPLVVPGLRIDATGIFVQPVIRGVTTTLASASSEANVATYVDGVYQQSTLGAYYDLPDVESVQVLKGPQGTLFGRNATGGAILINTRKPDLNAPHGMAYGSFGRYNSLILKGFVTAPIVENRLSFSLTGLLDQTDGWKRDLLRNTRKGADIKSYLVRGKLRFIPWDGADFTLTGLYSKRLDNNVLKTTNYLGNNISRSIDPSLPIASRPWTHAADQPRDVQRKTHAVTLHGEIEAGPGTISTTTHYDKTNSNGQLEVDNGAARLGSFDYPAYARNIEQELLYTTDQLGSFRAVGGLFYYSLLSEAVLNISDFTQAVYLKDKADAYAAFGEVTLDVTDRLSLVGGLRYSYEKRQANAVVALNTPVQPPYNRLGSKSWDAFTPRASVLYKATEATNLYFTYAKGFTSGSYNTAGLQTVPVDPENVDSYEVGVKSSELDGLSINAAGFYYKYKDLQITTISQQGTLIIQTLANAAAAEIYGGELNATWKASDSFDITLGGTYLHARYTDFPNAPVQIPTGFGGNRPTPTDVSGNTMIRSPTFSGNVTAHYRKEVRGGAFDASATVFHSTKVYQEFGNRIVQPSYTLVNGTFSFKPDDLGLTVSFWGKNLTNEKVISAVIVAALYDSVEYLPPRTYGMSLQFDF